MSLVFFSLGWVDNFEIKNWVYLVQGGEVSWSEMFGTFALSVGAAVSPINLFSILSFLIPIQFWNFLYVSFCWRSPKN